MCSPNVGEIVLRQDCRFVCQESSGRAISAIVGNSFKTHFPRFRTKAFSRVNDKLGFTIIGRAVKTLIAIMRK